MHILSTSTEWLATRGTLIAFAALCLTLLARCGGN